MERVSIKTNLSRRWFRTATNMSRSRSVWFATLLLLAPPLPAAEHVGLGSTDKFLQCVAKVFGKRAWTTAWKNPGEDVVCPVPKGVLIKDLKEKGFSVVEEKSFVLLVPSGMMPGGGGYVSFRTAHFNIETQVAAFEPRVSGSRSLNTAEMDAAAKVILRESRPVPIAPVDLGEPGGVVKVRILLQLDAHRLKPDVESVIGILGEPRGDKRIIYGELRAGRYHMLWDSPLVGGGDFGLGYQDLDGDGVQEILASARAYTDGTALAVFSAEGRELTRQECPADMGGDASGSACPIVGREVTFESLPGGRRDILAVPYRSDGGIRPDRYILTGGRYVLQPFRSRPRVQSEDGPDSEITAPRSRPTGSLSDPKDLGGGKVCPPRSFRLAGLALSG
jgi:hypothetical protein